MNVKEGLLYSKSHEWVRVEGDKGYVGITDYAQHNMGDIVFVDAPEEGDELDTKEAFGVIESVKAASDVYLPVGGKVVEVNEDVIDDPALINSNPYDSWVIAIEIQDKDSLDNLLSSKDYEAYLNEVMDESSKEDWYVSIYT